MESIKILKILEQKVNQVDQHKVCFAKTEKNVLNCVKQQIQDLEKNIEENDFIKQNTIKELNKGFLQYDIVDNNIEHYSNTYNYIDNAINTFVDYLVDTVSPYL